MVGVLLHHRDHIVHYIGLSVMITDKNSDLQDIYDIEIILSITLAFQLMIKIEVEDRREGWGGGSDTLILHKLWGKN